METGFEPYQERRPPGLIFRFFEISSQLIGLALGGGLDFVRQKKELGEHRSLGILLLRFFLALTWPFLDKSIVNLPFSTQFRLRLQKLGPTYIKLGQILSLREDLLPKVITDELKNLLDKLPAVSYERFKELIVESFDLPLNSMYRWIDPVPLGSASLAQTHRARLISNEKVVIKVLKPGVRTIIERDTRLLRFLAGSCRSSWPVISQPESSTNSASTPYVKLICAPKLIMLKPLQRTSKTNPKYVSLVFIENTALAMCSAWNTSTASSRTNMP